MLCTWRSPSNHGIETLTISLPAREGLSQSLRQLRQTMLGKSVAACDMHVGACSLRSSDSATSAVAVGANLLVSGGFCFTG